MARSPSPSEEARRRADRDDRDDDTQPWLDEDGGEDHAPTHTLVGRRTFWALLFLAAAMMIAVAAGIWMVSGREKGNIDIPPPGAELPLVRNPGPWKIPPTGPGTEGEVVEGQGQTIFGTGDGADPGGRVAVEALPEEPVDLSQMRQENAAQAAAPAPPPEEKAPTNLLPPAATPPPPPAKQASKPAAPAATPSAPKAVSAAPKVVSPTPKAVSTPPKATPAETSAETASGSGTTLQLGAFSSEARARSAWEVMSKRFSYLADMKPLILPTAKDGKTLYRLRTQAGTHAQAVDICGRLRVAGEACSVVG